MEKGKFQKDDSRSNDKDESGHSTEERHLFLEEVICEMCCVGQVRVDDSMKGKDDRDLRMCAEGKNSMRNVIWN